MSSANILFETSTAKTISTPCRFTVSNLVPIFGFTNAIVKNAKARLSKTFSRNYENHSFHVITPENVEDYLLEQINLE